jgi:hypothetical protein
VVAADLVAALLRLSRELRLSSVKPLEKELSEPYYREIDYDPYIQIIKTIESAIEEAFSFATSKPSEQASTAVKTELSPVKESIKDEATVGG